MITIRLDIPEYQQIEEGGMKYVVSLIILLKFNCEFDQMAILTLIPVEMYQYVNLQI